MRAALFLVIVIVIGLVTGPLTGIAHADIREAKSGKVSVDIPTKWSFDAKDLLIRAVSPDNGVAFVLLVVESSDLKEGLKRIEGELYSSIQGLKWVDKVRKLSINKLPGKWVEGTGVNARGTQLDVLVVLAGPTAAKKGVIMMAIVEHEKLAANTKAIQGIFKTLKPTK